MRLKGRIAVALLIGIPLVAIGIYVLSSRDVGQPRSEDDFLRRVEEARREAGPSEGPGLVAPDSGGKGAAPKPVISVNEEDLEFGVIPNTEPTLKEVPIRNLGDATLEVKDIESSCRCTVVDWKRGDVLKVAPGGEAFVKVTMLPDEIAGFEATRTLTFMSNDPKTPMVVLPTHAQIEPEFELVPNAESLDFGDVEKGSRAEKTFLVRQLGEEPIKVEEITKKGGMNGVEFSFETLPPEEWQSPNRTESRVRVALNTEELPTGPFKGLFYLGTTCERVPWLPCRVEASVNSFFTVEPASLSLLKLKAGETELGAVIVKANRPIEIRDVSVSANDIKARVERGRNPNSARVEVTIAEGAQTGKREEQLTFTVASDEESVRHTTRIHGLLRATAKEQARQKSAAPGPDDEREKTHSG